MSSSGSTGNNNDTNANPDETNKPNVVDKSTSLTPDNAEHGVELSPVASPNSHPTKSEPELANQPPSQATMPLADSSPQISPAAAPEHQELLTLTHLPVDEEQIADHEAMLSKARKQLDEILTNEENKTKSLLVRRENLISKLWWALIAGHLVCFLTPFLIWILWFNPKTQVTDWTYSHSFFDAIIVIAIRLVFGLLCVFTTSSDEKRVFILHTFGYWITVTAFVLNIAKLMIISWYSANRAVLAVFMMLTSTILLILHQKFTPLDVHTYDDDDEEKEAAAHRKKLHLEALERADALSRRLEGQALEEHRLVEEKRLKSYEFVEKLILRSQIQHRYESQVSFLEFVGFLRPYFWPKGVSWIYHAIVIMSWVLLLGSKACSIISPLYIGYAVDELVTTGNIPWKNIGLYVGISLLSQLIKQVQNALYLAVKQQAFIEISSSLLRHLLSLSHSYHHSQSLGKTVRGMDRALTSADNVVQYLVLLILPTFFEIIVIAIIFYLKFKSPLLAAIIFVHLTAYAILTIQLTLIRKPLRKRMTTQDNKFHSIFQEAMSNYDIVRSFNTEEYEISRYTSAVTHYQHFAVAIQYTLSFLNSVQQVVISSTLLCALFTTAWDVSRKRLTIGAMSSIVGYVNSIYAPLTFMGTVFEFLINSLIDCRYVLELRKVQPDIVDCENPSVLTLPTDGKPPVIEFKNVKFTYPSETGRGVRNLNFKFSGSTALVGSTGSGKSTIMRLLLRFYDPQEGEILINGHNIKHVTNQSLKDALCVIPQESSMFNTTILANLKYGNPDATVDQVIAACKVAEIYDLIASFPKQMETVVGESSKKLSGGEKQRLALARAILRSLRTAKVVQEGAETKFNEDGTVIEEYDEDGFPVMHFGGVILADEYTSALDSETEKAIQKSLKKLERGTTSVIIAHRLSTIVHCENIIVMGDGEILEMGTHQSLMELGGKYANLWNIQFDQSMVEDLTTDKSNSSN